MKPLVKLGIIISLMLHIVDQATDVFAGFLFYFEGHLGASIFTLCLVFLPGFCICIAELRRSFCSQSWSIVKALGYLLCSPLWAIIIHLYSLCDERYLKSALFFKAIQGFVEAGPQFAFQLSLLLKGGWGESSKLVIEPILPITTAGDQAEDYPTMTATEEIEENNGSLLVFDRIYHQEDRYYFGLVHVASVVMSFLSILSATIIFNDIESINCISDDPPMEDASKSCSGKAAGKLIFGVPFFLFTLIYRAVGIALLICFLQMWSGVIMFGLFFINVLTGMIIGDDFYRSLVYALWSLFVPVGYSRNPEDHMDYTKVPLFDLSTASIKDEEKDSEKSSMRSKHFLTIHVLTSIFIIGTSLIIMMVLVFTYPDLMQSRVAFKLNLLPLVFLPLLGLSLAFSVFLVRPYHRCDCSGGEAPKGNIIV